MQLLKLQSENEPRIATWFEKKTDKYTASDMQNGILKEMTLDILQKVIESLDHKGDSATMVLHPYVVPVANQIQAEEPRAVYTHCYEHSLHLPCSDAVTDCKITWNALDTLYDIIKLVKKSPHHVAAFQRLKDQLPEDSPGRAMRIPLQIHLQMGSLVKTGGGV